MQSAKHKYTNMHKMQDIGSIPIHKLKIRIVYRRTAAIMYILLLKLIKGSGYEFYDFFRFFRLDSYLKKIILKKYSQLYLVSCLEAVKALLFTCLKISLCMQENMRMRH